MYTLGRAYLVSTVDVRTIQKHTEVAQVSIPVRFGSYKGLPSRPLTAGPMATTAPSSVTILRQFDGSNQQNSCGCVPPDVQVAAGPNYVMELVNDLASIYTKNGTLVSTLPLTTLFNSGGAFSDPKVLYDASSNRWFISVIDGLIKGVDFGISVNSDPLVWNNYQIHDPVGFSDQPIIGVSDDKLVISVNDFSGNTLLGAHYWVFNKAEMVAGLAAIDFASFGPFANL